MSTILGAFINIKHFFYYKKYDRKFKTRNKQF